MHRSAHSPTGSAATDVTSAVVARLRAAGCVYAEEESAMLLTEARSADDLEQMVVRRTEGLPLEHILGWAEFCGLRVLVEPGVFVPRRRTALLVSEAAGLAPPGAVVLDLCSGSGAIGVALAAVAAPVELHAVDLDPVAVRCARRNVEPIGGTVYRGDLAAPLPGLMRGRVDLVVACPPYVPTSALPLMPNEAREHEPLIALDGGHDGLDIVRRLAGVAAEWLAPGGHLLVESTESQSRGAVAAFARHGLVPRVVVSEELGATVVIGSKPLGVALDIWVDPPFSDLQHPDGD